MGVDLALTLNTIFAVIELLYLEYAWQEWSRIDPNSLSKSIGIKGFRHPYTLAFLSSRKQKRIKEIPDKWEKTLSL
jgi:hypothetical protein